MALAVIALLALPFVVGLVRLEREGWVLNSDDALLGLRSLDVFSGDPPLTGQPSTSESAGGDVRTFHPGPIEMWAFAPLVAVLGGWGMVIGASAVNLAAVLTAVALAYRRLGPTGGLVAAGLAALFLRSVGTSVLSDPVSSNLWGVPIIAVALATWAVLDGDHRVLPLLAIWASWTAQQHLAAVIPTATLVVVALVGVAVPLVSGRVRHRSFDRGPLHALGLAALIGLVLWSPVLVQQATGDEGNITAVITYAGVEGRTTQGFSGAFHIAVRSMEPVPMLLRTDVSGIGLVQAPGAPASVAVVLVVLLGLGAALAPGLVRRARLLLTTGLVLLPAGLLNASNIPNIPGTTVEVLRINIHRWVWPFSSLLAIGLVWALADLAWRRAEAAGDRPVALTRARTAVAGRGAVVGVAVMAIVVALGVVPRIADDPTHDVYSSPVTRAVLDAVEADMGDASTVLLIAGGAAAELSIVPAMTFALERDGIEVQVPERLETYFGDRGTDGDWDAAYLVTSDAGSRPAVVGRPIADLIIDGRLAETTEQLSASLRLGAPRLNPTGDAVLAELTFERAFPARLTVMESADDPVAALLDPVVVELLDGGVDGVRLDPALLARHRELLAERHQVWDASRMLVLRVERGEVEALLEQQSGGLR